MSGSHRGASGPVEYRFPCSVCNAMAATIWVAPEDSQLPERPGPYIAMEGIQIDVEHHGHGAFRRTITAQEAVAIARAVDKQNPGGLRRIGRDISTFICGSCELAYCMSHMPLARIDEPGGSPLYDYYFEARCPEGHTSTVERD